MCMPKKYSNRFLLLAGCKATAIETRGDGPQAPEGRLHSDSILSAAFFSLMNNPTMRSLTGFQISTEGVQPK